HREDNAETILLNTIRGTGLKGLTGMDYRRDKITRPLLDVSREEIKDYLNTIGQDYVDDSTNEVADVKRNFVRLKVLPLLRHLNPSITDTLVANGQRAAEAMKFIEQHNTLKPLATDSNNLTIKKSDIVSETTLFGLLSQYGFSPAVIENIYAHLDDTPGAVFESDTHRLLRDRDCLIIKTRGEVKPLKIVTRLADVSEFATMPRKKDTVCLDADKVGDHLETRLTKKGDRFVPLGMRGSKLVSDYLTDRKTDLFSKQSQTVLTNGKDIIWLVGREIDDRYKVVEGVTKRLLICSVAK
ncbi:MAG: ATP-binding protein, partial [Bacteroidaceae bacterium]